MCVIPYFTKHQQNDQCVFFHFYNKYLNDTMYQPVSMCFTNITLLNPYNNPH